MTTVYNISPSTLSQTVPFNQIVRYNGIMPTHKTPRNWMIRMCSQAFACYGAAAWAAPATPPKLTDAVPSEIVAAVFVAGPGEQQSTPKPWSALDLAQPLADQAHQFGLLSMLGSKVRVWVDALASLSMVLEHPHALVLFDIHAERRVDGGHQLKDLRAALITNTPQSNKAIEQRIQHLLTTYTNSTESTLTKRTVHGHEVFTLRDRRLPSWMSFSWGRMNTNYVVGLGDGTLEQIAQTLSGRHENVAGDRWFKAALSKMERVPSSLVFYVQLDRLRTCLDDSLGKKINNVLEALSLDRTQRGLLALGMDGRSVEVAGMIHRDGHNEMRTLISSEFHTPLTKKAVPQQARRFALVDAKLGSALEGLTEAVWSARSRGARLQQEVLWADIDKKAGVRLKQDIYGRLGGPLILHDYPRHPLGLAFAWNMVVPIQGDATDLRRDLDRWLEEVQRLLARGNGIQLQRGEKGLWYTQFGLVGPAVTVTDRYLVLGFSPETVRQIRLLVDTP